MPRRACGRRSPRLLLLALLLTLPNRDALATLDTIGGDDVLVAIEGSIRDPDIAIASNGDIFLAASEAEEFTVGDVNIHRSQDGGETWELWGTLSTMGGGGEPKMVIAGSSPEMLHVAYTSGLNYTVEVASSPVAAATASFTQTTVLYLGGLKIWRIDLATDAANFSPYNLYLAATTDFGDGQVWFARSTTAGSTWEAPYPIAEATNPEWSYFSPSISYGYGGVVHVVWVLYPGGDASLDEGVLYRRALNRAAGGIADWEPVEILAPVDDGITQRFTEIVASDDSDYVSLFFGEEFEPFSRYRLSKNRGADWNLSNSYTFLNSHDFDAAKAPGGAWVVGVAETSSPEFSILRAPADVPMDWDAPGVINDSNHTDSVAGYNPIALDPTRSHRAAMAWTFRGSGVPDTLFFDAEWRADPGYPNLEDGFPVSLPTEPTVAPALVDVAGDDRLEIVFGDQEGFLRVYDAAGQPVPGWPQDVGTFPTNGSIAVGDLNGNGEPVVVAGNDAGQIFVYDGNGELQPGWPVQLTNVDDVHLAIGSLGPPYARYVVACVGNRMWVLNYAGQIMPGYPVLFGDVAVGPPAIGDVDDDGVNEIVSIKTEWIHVHEYGSVSPEYYRHFTGETLRGRPSLGDVDLDGDLEIAVPTETGKVYLVEHTLVDRPGWPHDEGESFAMTNVAIADNLFDDQLELAFGAQDYTVHLFFQDGAEQSSYPKFTTPGWWLFGAPVIDDIDRTTSNVVVAARDQLGWSWHNTGASVLGWPKDLSTRVELGPACGDIDLDGRNEVVFVGLTELVVVDVAHPPSTSARERWPMDGHDAQRTGCAACVEPVVTGVPVAGLPSTVRFRSPHPNPSSSGVNLAFEIPRSSAIDVNVYDLRGRRVRGLMRQEVDPGEVLLPWDGRDDRGAELASGAYFVRLRVRSEGRDETLTRKVVFVR